VNTLHIRELDFAVNRFYLLLGGFVKVLAISRPIALVATTVIALVSLQLGAIAAHAAGHAEAGRAALTVPARTGPAIMAGDFGFRPAPVITGDFTVGSTLTATHEKWTDPVPEKMTYQWYLMGTVPNATGVAIPGATGLTYSLTGADVSRVLALEINGSAPGYNGAGTRAQTPRIKPRFQEIPAPAISGTAKIGQTLTALPGVWAEGTQLTYVWGRHGFRVNRDPDSLDGGNTYTLTEADAGADITVQLCVSRPGYISNCSLGSAAIRVPSYWTVGVIAKKHATMAAVLGEPSNYQFATKVDGGLWQSFERGSISYTSATGALAVINGINLVWTLDGAYNSELGYPTSEEFSPAAGGVMQNFQYGKISWNPVTHTRITKGGIGFTWDQAGGPRGGLGYPTTDEYVPKKDGIMQGFQYGKISWNPVTGSRITKGGIGATWDRLGGPFYSGLGYPATNEYAVSGGGFAQDFQAGRITWRPGNMTVEYAR
jgi:uncharacterized protein with LGFP repeats